MPALKPIPAAGSRQVEKRGKTNKPWNSTLNAPRSAPHAPVPGLRPGLGDGSPLAGPWIGFRRDSRAAVSAGGRPCNGNPRTKTGTNHRTLAPRPLAHPRRPIASPDGLGGVGGLSIWLWPLFGSSLADHPEIPTSSCDSLHSLAGPLAWSAEAANLVPSLSHGLSMPALARSPRRTPRRLVVASPWCCVAQASKQHQRTPGWDDGAPAYTVRSHTSFAAARVDRLRCCLARRCHASRLGRCC